MSNEAKNSLKGAHHRITAAAYLVIGRVRHHDAPRSRLLTGTVRCRVLSRATIDAAAAARATLRLAPLLLCRMRLAALHVYRFGKGLAFASCADGCRASSRYGWDLSLLPLSCFCLALGRSSMCKDTSLCQVFDAQRGRFASERAPGTSV